MIYKCILFKVKDCLCSLNESDSTKGSVELICYYITKYFVVDMFFDFIYNFISGAERFSFSENLERFKILQKKNRKHFISFL